jgi:hypothetical protein
MGVKSAITIHLEVQQKALRCLPSPAENHLSEHADNAAALGRGGLCRRLTAVHGRFIQAARCVVYG